MQAGSCIAVLTGRGAAGLLGFGLALSACATVPPQPMTLPPADGRAESVLHEAYRYDVGRRDMAEARGEGFLRVTRAGGPDLDYSDGLVAKRVAEAYCGHYNRSLDPVAYGMFSAPASWIFEVGCT